MSIVPVLVKVTDCVELTVCTCCAGKVSEAGATVAAVKVADAVIRGTCQMPRP